MLSSLAIVGVGLIGGSLSLALKKQGHVGEVWGVVRNPHSGNEALRLGLVDRLVSLQEAAQAQVILVATPVAQMPAVFSALEPHLSTDSIITDGGSTKCDVVLAAREALGVSLAQFVPAHPIAGTEKSGPSAAFDSLYQNRKVVLTPLPETKPAATHSITQMWQAAGATVKQLSPEAHDRIFAAVSHLPHLLAFALVEQLATDPQAEEYFSYAASGFRDFTRIAGSSPEMWRDILLANRDAVLAHLQTQQMKLTQWQELLARNDVAALMQHLETASHARRQWQHHIETGEPLQLHRTTDQY
ncbi:MAG: hypothetical protein RLZZ502_967 [Pseudomonadota bacterium]|jgi:prephenate dehydrogenase